MVTTRFLVCTLSNLNNSSQLISGTFSSSVVFGRKLCNCDFTEQFVGMKMHKRNVKDVFSAIPFWVRKCDIQADIWLIFLHCRLLEVTEGVFNTAEKQCFHIVYPLNLTSLYRKRAVYHSS